MRIAPLQHAHGIVAMAFYPLHQLVLERFAVGCRAEGAVIHVTPGTPGELADLVGTQGAHARPVELLAGGESDMIDIHVQAHADGVGRHQEVDIARLIQIDLGIAGARTERAQHNRRAAALATDHFGDAVDILRGKTDHRRTAGQAGQLLRAGIGQVGKAGAADEPGLGNKPLDNAAHRVATQQHRLFVAAGMQQPVGEDMAAFGIGAELDFVNHKAGDRNVQRHGLDGADIEPRILRNDLFFAGDQRDFVRSAQLHDAVVHFARQKAQRQSDHAGLVRQHAFDGEKGLAGVGRPQDRGNFGNLRAASAGGVHGMLNRVCPCLSQAKGSPG